MIRSPAKKRNDTFSLPAHCYVSLAILLPYCTGSDLLVNVKQDGIEGIPVLFLTWKECISYSSMKMAFAIDSTCDPGHNDVTRPQLPELSWWSYPLFNPIIPGTNLLHLHPKHSLVPKTPQSFTRMRGHRVNAKLTANPCPCHEKSSQACRWEVGQPQYFLKTNSSSFWCKYFTMYLSIVTWSCSHNGTACLQGVVRAPLSGLLKRVGMPPWYQWQQVLLCKRTVAQVSSSVKRE